MANHSTREAELQVVTLTNSDGIPTDLYVDPATGAVVEPLRDDKFPQMRKKKRGNLRLADIYRAAGYAEYADRARSCATWLLYLGNAARNKKQLHAMNACRLRLCPFCNTRKARIMGIRLSKIIQKVKDDHTGTQLIFLTLTMANVPGDKLRDALTQLTGSWSKLTRRTAFVVAVKGFFRVIEITRNRADDTYHPHIHAILIVEDGYFVRKNGLYITHDQWVTMWQQSLRASYRPVVGIQSTYSKGGKGRPSKGAAAAAAAVAEAAKYATKDAEYIGRSVPDGEAVRVVRTYTEALRGKRMTALGGWMKDAAKQLALDMEDAGDLVHEDGGGELTEATAELLLSYGWHFGVSDHILTDVQPNPDYQGGGDADDVAGQG